MSKSALRRENERKTINNFLSEIKTPEKNIPEYLQNKVEDFFENKFDAIFNHENDSVEDCKLDNSPAKSSFNDDILDETEEIEDESILFDEKENPNLLNFPNNGTYTEEVAYRKRLKENPLAVRKCRQESLSERQKYQKQKDFTNRQKLEITLGCFLNIVEDCYELTAEEFDILYSANFIKVYKLEHTQKKIDQYCPIEIKKECYFSSKNIILRLCWPAYYREHYPKLTAFDILANDKIKAGLSLVSKHDVNKINFGEEIKDKTRNYGAIVDTIIYNAINDAWPQMFSFSSVKDMFIALANPKKSGLDKLSGFRVISGRGCYPSPLDFYMWNSPIEFQRKHLLTYLDVREKSGLQPLPEIELITYAYFKEQSNHS